jgi:hypothetical protein
MELNLSEMLIDTSKEAPIGLLRWNDGVVFRKQLFLSDLLPYEPEVKRRDSLESGFKEYLLLLSAAEGAMLAFQKGDLDRFDPLVGENACQIRAIAIAALDSNPLEHAESRRVYLEIIRSKAKCEELLLNIEQVTASEHSLGDYLSDLDVSVSVNQLFLISSFILSLTKVTKPFKLEKPLLENASTDAKRIKEVYDVGTAFAWNVVKHLRKGLSRLSVQFVQQVAGGSMAAISEDSVVMHNGLSCLPYYWTARALMDYALKSGVPIVMIADKKASDCGYNPLQTKILFFKVVDENYKAVPVEELEENKAAFVLMGSTCRLYNNLPKDDREWTAQLLEYNILDLLFAYSSSHRQYPDESKDSLLTHTQDLDYLYYKEKAQEWGCSMTHPGRFFLAHAYCDKIRNVKARFSI